MIAETFLELITDANHWGFEIVATLIQDVIILGLAWPFLKRAIARHDLKKHKNECDH